MTNRIAVKNRASEIFYKTALALLLILPLVFSEEIREGFSEGARLSFEAVLPAVFPYMILSKMIASFPVTGAGVLPRLFSKITGLPPLGWQAFVMGNAFGFPSGATVVHSLYSRGCLTESEAERLTSISNNPSPAFTVLVVGGGVMKSVRLGICLYFCVLAATVICVFLFRQNERKSVESHEITGQNESFASFVKDAGASCIAATCFIILFSMLLSALRAVIKARGAIIPFAVLFEVSNGVKEISCVFPKGSAAIPLLAFSLGFSGLSYHLQTAALLPEGILTKRYYLIKLIEGIIAAVLGAILSPFIIGI